MVGVVGRSSARKAGTSLSTQSGALGEFLAAQKEMGPARWLKGIRALTTIPDYFNWVPRTHAAEGEN